MKLDGEVGQPGFTIQYVHHLELLNECGNYPEIMPPIRGYKPDEH